MKKDKLLAKRKLRRKRSIRKNISGTSEVPRLTVFRSNSHIYAQIINDVESKTLVSASTLDNQTKGKLNSEMSKSEKSKLVGQEIAQKALSANIKKVAFDRNGLLYHGRIKALADSAREAGLQF